MPNFFVFVRSFHVLPRRIALFATLLIAALSLSVYQVPQQPNYSQVIYSQDISLITELPAHRHILSNVECAADSYLLKGFETEALRRRVEDFMQITQIFEREDEDVKKGVMWLT